MFYNKAKIIVDVKSNRKGLRNNTYKSLLRATIPVCLVLNSELLVFIYMSKNEKLSTYVSDNSPSIINMSN